LRRERENLISSLNNSGELAQSDGERECDVTVFNTSVYKPVEKGTLPKANFYAAHDVWHNAPSGVRNTFAMRDSRRLIVDIGRVSAADDAQETTATAALLQGTYSTKPGWDFYSLAPKAVDLQLPAEAESWNFVLLALCRPDSGVPREIAKS